MSAGNLIEVSFGKPGGAPSGGAAENRTDDASAAVAAEFTKYAGTKGNSLLARARAVFLFYKKGLVSVGLEMPHDNLIWLEQHPNQAGQLFGKIAMIETADGHKWTVRAKGLVRSTYYLKDGYLCLHFLVEEDKEEEKNWKGSVVFCLSKG